MANSHHQAPTARSAPARQLRWCPLTVGVFLILIGLFIQAAPGETSKLLTESADADWRLACQARQSLSQDSRLAAFNLGVSVRNRVATLWGPIASTDLARIAESRLRAMPGLREVHNELWVAPDDAGELPKERSSSQSERPTGVTGARTFLETRRGDPRPWRPARTTRGPGERRPQAALTGQGAGRSQAPAMETLPSILISVPEQAAPENGPRTPAASPTDGSVRLGESIRRLAGQRQYLGIDIDVRGGLVYLRGPVARSDDVFALAEAVGKLPGVERVIVQRQSAADPRLQP